MDCSRPTAVFLLLHATALRTRQPCCIRLVSDFLNRPRLRTADSRFERNPGAKVAAQSHKQQAVARGARMLRTALGLQIDQWLDDESVVEVMLNPDGRLWLDRLKSGLEDASASFSPEDGERIIRLVAHHVGAEAHAGAA